MNVSFIVCTRNRAAVLPVALDAIAAEAHAHPGEVELVIVDNGSTDSTADVIGRWAAGAALPVRSIDAPRPGLAAARNAGMAAATGRLLAFTDDDCALVPGYLADLRRHFDADTAPAIRGGRVELGDARDLPFTVKTTGDRVRLARGMHPGTVVLGCNMVFPRALVDVVGQFDERFGAGARFKAAEETDYIYRAHRAGMMVEYVPDMAVRHFHGRRQPAEIARLGAGYFVGNGALYAKHLRNGWLIHHLRWDAMKAAAELFGGRRLDAALDLSYRKMVLRNVQGMALFWFGPRP